MVAFFAAFFPPLAREQLNFLAEELTRIFYLVVFEWMIGNVCSVGASAYHTLSPAVIVVFIFTPRRRKP